MDLKLITFRRKSAVKIVVNLWFSIRKFMRFTKVISVLVNKFALLNFILVLNALKLHDEIKF